MVASHAQAAREAVRDGRLRGAALLQALARLPFDQRDAWLDELLALPGVPADQPGLPPGTVPYLPCDADVVMRAVQEAPLGAADVFVDLGAGLGRPAMLAHLLSGAAAVGVELQPHLVDQARAAAAQLDLRAVRFLHGDASSLPVAGDVFFIYSSFNGAALSRVLQTLRRASPRVLCAVGFEVPGLRARPSSRPDLVFYDFDRP